MKCGNPDPVEDALVCKDCDLKVAHEDPATDKMCPMHEAWTKALATGCPPTKEAIADLRANFPQLFHEPDRG